MGAAALPLWPPAVAFLAQLLGYALLSSALQHAFYHRQRGQEAAWKIQHGDKLRRQASVPGEAAHAAGRHPRHALFCTTNLLMASGFAGLVVEASLRGWNQLKCQEPGLGCLLPLGWPAVKAVFAQLLLEYYWHRLMHWPPCYKALHKFHHHYKSPRPFDDLFIHPLEAFGYYCILYLVPTSCLGHMPPADFALYMALHGLLGVLDHSGVDIRIPLLLYSVADHDAHHQYFNVNYGFPWVLMDKLHGTLHSAKRRPGLVQ